MSKVCLQMLMDRWIRLSCALVACFLAGSVFTGCASKETDADVDISALFVAKDASSIRKDQIGSNEQISFVVIRQYPLIDITDAGVQKLKASGWSACSSRSSEWSSFVDQATGSAVLIHQRLLHFKKGSSLVVYSARYRSRLGADVSVIDRSKPLTDQQSITIQKMKLGDPEMKPFLESQGVVCNA